MQKGIWKANESNWRAQSSCWRGRTCSLRDTHRTRPVLSAGGVQKKLRRGAAAEGMKRLMVATSGAAVSWCVVGNLAELFWSAGIVLREWPGASSGESDGG